MMPLTLGEIAGAVSGELLPVSVGDAVCSGVSTDSRQVREGHLYVAIRGERVDGHSFVNDAFGAGAVACMVSEPQEGAGPWILVDEPVTALGRLAAHYRRRMDPTVIGITGSNGKTTTKDMVAAALGGHTRVLKTEGNRNNELGMPLTILGSDGGHRIAVLEMGMRGPGQIAYLASIAQPDIGIVTNVGDTHIELLGSREAIRDAKAELVAALPADGTAVLNWDDPLVRGMADATGAGALFYGLGEGAHVRAVDVDEQGLGGTTFRVVGEWRGQRVDQAVSITLPGMHNVMNALAACSAALATGVPMEAAAAGLADLAPTGMRMQAIDGINGTTIINDAYNASPSSMRAALDTLAAMDIRGKRIAVLSNMLELGDQGPQYHEGVGRYAAECGIDLLATTGDLAASIHAGYIGAGGSGQAVHLADKDALAGYLRDIMATGDVVLVKGSRGMRMETVVEALAKA